MPIRSLLLLLAILPAGCRTVCSPATQQPAAYLFSYFVGNGEDGLHLAASSDGLTWTALNGGRSLLVPRVGGTLMRDPSICRGPDGVFHMVWTTGWHDRGIGLAHSRDLIHWSDQTFLGVMEHEPNAQNCWAPEICYDRERDEFLIVWSTTIPGRFPETEPTEGGDRVGSVVLNHRLYAVTTHDFETFSPPQLFYDDGFNVIDGTLVQVGDGFRLIVKDETRAPQPAKNLRVSRGPTAQGPFGPASDPISPAGLWVEGPTVLRVGSAWILYYDAYRAHRFGALRTEDFEHWTDVSDQLHMPPGMRHGTAFTVDPSVLDPLRRLP